MAAATTVCEISSACWEAPATHELDGLPACEACATEPERCEECDGRGELRSIGHDTDDATCPACGGTCWEDPSAGAAWEQRWLVTA